MNMSLLSTKPVGVETVATKSGWTHAVTGEILVAVKGLMALEQKAEAKVEAVIADIKPKAKKVKDTVDAVAPAVTAIETAVSAVADAAPNVVSAGVSISAIEAAAPATTAVEDAVSAVEKAVADVKAE